MDTADAINQLTPQQRQAVMMKAQQEANQSIMQSMMEKMTSICFKKCAGHSVSSLWIEGEVEVGIIAGTG